MGTAANVRVGVTGKVYGGTGTLPTTTTATPAGTFNDMGLIGDKGIVQSLGRTTKKVMAWGGDVVRVVTTAHDLTYKLVFLETNQYTLQAATGDTTATASAAKIMRNDGVRQEWILDVVDGAKLIRLCIPDGQITDVGDVAYATEDAVGYECTITCYPDSSNVKAYEYLS